MDYTNLVIPNHVAIILDGNGRWATERNMTRSEGHYHGFNNLDKLSNYIFTKGIKVLSVYAFSTENFKRSEEEVNYLMNLFTVGFKKYLKSAKKNDIKIVFSGRREPLPKNVLAVIDKVTLETKNNTKGIFNICVNYGGQSEIIDATKRICKDVIDKKISIDDMDEQLFNKYMYHELPPIDLLIRTSGENRISNYMLWQLSYSEFYFPETYFPAFDNEEFDIAILEFNKRNRRFGGINYDNKDN